MPTTPSLDPLFETLESEGYVVVPDVLAPDTLESLRAGLNVVLEHHPVGRNDFEGRSTERVYALLEKCPAVAALVEHPLVMGLADRVLEPGFLLSSVQAIRIHPGESAQPLHSDDDPAVFPRPRPPYGLSTMWAIDPFTKANGSTRLVPRSHRKTEAGPPDDSEAISVEMSPGSVLVYLGGVEHGGGAHVTGPARLGVSIIYCQPWLRQFENLMLAISRETARGFSPRLQEMIGYGLFRAFGSVDGRNPRFLLDADGSGGER